MSTNESTDDRGASPHLDGSRAYALLSNAARKLGRTVRNSWLYGWLTKEPDPEVIVIDLRETRTVGPFLRVLDRLVESAVEAADDSVVVDAGRAGVERVREAPLQVGGRVAIVAGALALLAALVSDASTTGLALGALLVVAGVVALREDRSWAELRETRPVELLIAAFEPPEPPAASESERTEPPGDAERHGEASGDGEPPAEPR